jgi:hypothetical protein
MRAARVVLCAWSVLLGACGDKPVPATDAGSDSSTGKPPYANNCVGIDCMCADAGANKSYCRGECVSLQDDLQNCGACGETCGEYQTCVRGACTCPTGELWCDARCTQVASDYQNCGGCGKRCENDELCAAGSCTSNTTGCTPPCAGDQSCQAGSCVCPSGQSLCDGRCVNVQNNPDHCGSCDFACGAELGCTNGVCGCARGETSCSEGCVDASSDDHNCGSCGVVCDDGEVCSVGECRAAWADGCNGEPAHELRVREIAAYQTVKIPLASQGQPIVSADRPVPVVQGRAALFRVFVDLGSNFSARDFAARLAIVNDGTISRYASKQRVSIASTDAKPDSTFIFNVPGDKITGNTKYSLQLVECAAGSGSVSQARFPASGEAELGARKAGDLNVTILPVRTNSEVPDTDPAALQLYREYLEAMYPVERVNFTVGKQIETNYPINWTTLVEQIRAQRKADAPAADVYYYGLVKPTDTLSTYCKSGCTAGIGYVSPAKQIATRAAVGLAFGDEISANTMAHELGHNHGRNHAPCSPSKISGVDEDYPVKDGRIDAWGYDSRKQVFYSPSSTNDLMGYCDPKWSSAYTYKALFDRVIVVNEIEGGLPPQGLPVAQYRVLIVDSDGARWSVPFDDQAEAFGERELAAILDINGQVVTMVDVYRTTLSEDSGSTILVPPPEPGWYSVRVSDSAALPFDAPVTVPGPQ